MLEERNLANHHLQQLEETYRQEIEGLKRGMAQRDSMLGEARKHLRQAEQEKREIIEGNTKLLVELGQEMDPKTAGQAARDNKYRELFKMYQFVIEENNELKKEVYLLKRNNLSQSQYQREETSLNISQSQQPQPSDTSVHKKVSRSKKSQKEARPPHPKSTKK